MIREPMIFEEFYELLVERMTPEEIIAFKASPEAQLRMHELLDKNSDGTITEDEQAELERTVEFEQIFAVIKAKAMYALSRK